MEPTIWGPKLWLLLHIIMVNPIAPQIIYKRFFRLLQYLLPCGKCRKHYRNHLKTIPFPKNQSHNASWLIKIHNAVNKSLNKPIIKIKEAKAFWESQSEKRIELNIKDIAHYVLETYDCYTSKKAHAYFWKHLPELLPYTSLDISEPPLKSKRAYTNWIKQLVN